jgi:hypothetical protein
MVTEFIEGTTLDHTLWAGLGEDERTQICSKLAEQLQHLRSIPPEGYYGRVHKQGWRSWLRLLRTDGRKLGGPYDTYDDFVSAMFAAAECTGAFMDSGDWHPVNESYLMSFKPTISAWAGHQPTLTHLDPGLYNTIVRKAQGTGEWEVTLIDWAEFGWYPAWMQSVALHNFALMITDKKEHDWAASREYLDKVMRGVGDAHPEHVQLFDNMYRFVAYSLM